MNLIKKLILKKIKEIKIKKILKNFLKEQFEEIIKEKDINKENICNLLISNKEFKIIKNSKNQNDDLKKLIKEKIKNNENLILKNWFTEEFLNFNKINKNEESNYYLIKDEINYIKISIDDFELIKNVVLKKNSYSIYKYEKEGNLIFFYLIFF
jgi:hypothetical protein